MNLFDWLFGRLRRRPLPPPKPPLPPSPGGDAAALLESHNAARVARLLRPLVLDPRLSSAAQMHASFMDRAGQLAHSGIGDGDPWSRIRAYGFEYQAAAENVAEGQPDADQVVVAWLGHPPHAANVLGPYDFVGFGRSGQYWCADYARA